MLSEVISLLAACAFVTAEDSYVVLPISRVPVSRNSTHHADYPVTKNIELRAVPEVLSNVVQYYTTFISIGKTKQLQEVIVDTGSSDLWVYANGTGAPYTFNPSDSEFINDEFYISYIDKSGASGSYYKDIIEWGNTTINCQFAVVNHHENTLVPQGFFGIGPARLEASYYFDLYPNYPIALKNAGKIQSTAYSLYLDNVNSTSGSLVFGAVDTSRYTGTLQLLPNLSASGFRVSFEVFGTQQTGSVDSGTSFTYLDDDLVYQIASSFGAYYDDTYNYYAIDNPPSNDLIYTFGETNVTVPASELWLKLEGDDKPYYLTILPDSLIDYSIILGDSFLRSAYVVYDIDSKQIAIAQANWNPGPSNYEVITSSGIPGAQ